jgi:hypothetical protein
MVRSPQVYDATKLYVAAAMRLMDDAHGSAPTNAISWDRWVRRAPGQFQRRNEVEETWSPVYGHRDDEIHALSEYDECISSIREDPVIGPQVDTLVGTALGGHRVEANFMPDSILTVLATEKRGWSFDDARFDSLYEEHESSLFAESFTYAVVVPLPGLQSNHLPISLDSDTVIDNMTEDEAVKAVRIGLFQPLSGDSPFITLGSEAALRATVSIPKLFGELAWERSSMEEATALFARLQTTVERGILALRLSTSGQIVAPGYFYFSNDWPVRGGISTSLLPSSPRLATFAKTYEIEGEQVNALSSAWREMASAGVARHRELGIALRRFSDAGARDRDDDTLIDLMIAAEALFLPGETQELRFKLSLRAAFFVAAEMGLTKAEVFRHMNRAYDARSRIVHGDVVENLTLVNGSVVPLQEFVRVTADHLRAALRKATRLASKSMKGGPLVDWDSLIVG